MGTRTIRFFHMVSLLDGATAKTDPVDWPRLIDQHLQRPPDERIFGQSADPLRAYASEIDPHQVTIGREVDEPGIQSSDHDGTKVEPLTPRDGEVFVKVGYIQFIPDTNIVAAIGGDAKTLPKGWLESFCDAIAPLGSMGRWGARPVVQKSQRERLSASTGVTRGEFKLSVAPQGLLEDRNRGAMGLDEALQALADSLQTDLDISLSIRPKGNNAYLGRKGLLSMLRDSNLLRMRASKAQAVSLTEAGAKEVLELVEHKLTAQVEIPKQTDETRSDDFLQRVLNATCVEYRDRLQTIFRALG